jgi:hypothetical protein
MAFFRDGRCLTPAMTSYNTPIGLVTDSGYQTTGYEGWRIFDGINNGSNYWYVLSNTGNVVYDFTISKTFKEYNIYVPSVNNAPKNWTIEGWNGSAWVVLDTRTNQTSWVADTKTYFSFNNTLGYTKCKINITATVAAFIAVGQFEILGDSSAEEQFMSGGT